MVGWARIVIVSGQGVGVVEEGFEASPTEQDAYQNYEGNNEEQKERA
jgi:hypothetical protein